MSRCHSDPHHTAHPNLIFYSCKKIKVIVITHSRSSGPSTPRVGIRYLHPSLKIYYLPIVPLTSDATLPQYLTNLPFLRNILIRERVEILHGHATLSSMALEGIMLAGFFKMPMDLRGVDQDENENRIETQDERRSSGDLPGKKQKIRTGMGSGVGMETETSTIRTVFTDHSLFEFGSAVGILTNKLLAGALRNIDAVVCVSHAG
jgi:phosphatidylinositol glycan class A protein